MNKYLAYPFLYDESSDLRCDFEILTDEISSMIGLLRSMVSNEDLGEDLSKINEIMYHINPSLRTKVAVTEEELSWLAKKVSDIQEEVKDTFTKFVLPQGCIQASYCHVIRSKCKSLIRLLSRYKQQGNDVEDILFDFVNLYSGYFFVLALKLNKEDGLEETEFTSRVY
ncbi:ATP:cob(I)alamin adenosyltransferase [Metaclostridioides mangenotii]|uniref:Corrinoid adenosyltransferase n=1 Tax=Metaclostridioides mangenotii TaxID=1540 RepID=A0ABS4ECU2_9FIRM|nr:ATP--cob(I)alamin adenosyltransferase [Clostridioides mangenotii]MBP1855772.1 ATP:cob(I)alamin adenosyltransferase [Clostridioides mangenotii]